MKHYLDGKPLSKADKIKSQVGMYMGTNVAPVKRKPRAIETRPRSQPERELRAACIKIFRRRGFKVKRIENGICGDLGDSIPDLLLFHAGRRFSTWVELKAPGGILSKGQIEFRELCLVCCVNHHVISSTYGAETL